MNSHTHKNIHGSVFFFRHEKLRIPIFFPTNQDFHGFSNGLKGLKAGKPLGEAFKALTEPSWFLLCFRTPKNGHLVTCWWFRNQVVSSWRVFFPLFPRWQHHLRWFSGRMSEALTLWFPGDRWVSEGKPGGFGCFCSMDSMDRWWRGTIQKTPGKSAWTA